MWKWRSTRGSFRLPQGRSLCLSQKSTTILKSELHHMQPEVRHFPLQGRATALNLQSISLGLLTFLSVFRQTIFHHLLPCSRPHTLLSASQRCRRELSPPWGGPRGFGRQPEVTLQAGDPWKGEVAVNTVEAEITGDGRGELELLGWKGGMWKWIKCPKPARIPKFSNARKNLAVSQKHL